MALELNIAKHILPHTAFHSNSFSVFEFETRDAAFTGDFFEF